MLGNIGIILKINTVNNVLYINGQHYQYDPSLNVSVNMIGHTVRYSLNKGIINHVELMVEKPIESKGKIQSLNISIPRFSLHLNGELIHFYITTLHYQLIKQHYQPGDFIHFSYNPNPVKNGKTYYYVITDIKPDMRKDKNSDDLLHKAILENDLKNQLQLINQATYYAFLDLEFSMSGPEFKGVKFEPEIIQFGIIVADQAGNMIERFSAYVKPNKFLQLSNLTKDFLKITDTTLTYGITYQDFYNYIKEIIARYQPVFMVWGVSDGFILENSYQINNVEPLFTSTPLIDLQRIHRQYYQISQDIGLYNAIKSYDLYEGTQLHDAIVDALVLKKIYFRFKQNIEANENYPFKARYLEIMSHRQEQNK